jgi:ethanolamine ammonia-lyase small subunit
MTTAVAPRITAQDRCDRCGAQAYVLVRLETGGELFFCAHHARKHDEVLRPMAAEWIDETERLAEESATR